MKHVERLAATVVVVCAFAVVAHAEVAVVMAPPDTVSAGHFSAFAFNPATDEFRTGGYIAGFDFRWSELMDDTVEPWDIDGGQLLSNFQMEIFARDGYAGNRSSYNLWGMDFCELDESFFPTGIASLKGPTGSNRLAAERDLVKHFPNFPDSPQVLPTNCWVSKAGGVYKLVDDNLTASDGFLAVGVQPGHRLTLYPVDFNAEIYARTYTITQVVSDNEVRLDQNPIFSGDSEEYGVGYFLSVQPHVTLGTFRQTIPYFAANLTTGPKAHYKGGISPDGSTLYLAEIVSANLVAVDTQTPETLSVFVSFDTSHDYVLAEVLSGRNFFIHPSTDIIYGGGSGDGLNAQWTDVSTGTTVDLENIDPTWNGTDLSVAATFDVPGAELRFHHEFDAPEDPPDVKVAAHYTDLSFWIHGGTTGGQTMTVNLHDEFNTPGIAQAVPVPTAGAWTQVQIPVSAFGVSTIGDVVWTSTEVFGDLVGGEDAESDELPNSASYWSGTQITSGRAQPTFYIDQVELVWTDPLPDGIYDFDTNGAGPAAAQVECTPDGRVWFAEGETDDILWTTNGVDLHKFLTSDKIVQAYIDTGALDLSNYYDASNKVQVMGLTVDRMGTVYWGDNQTNSIWKTSAAEPADNIIELATKQEIQQALGLGTASPRGINCFTLRGTELLTFNFVDRDCMYKVDLETSDYGDYDDDLDADADDYGLFFSQCLAGPGVSDPPVACTNGFPEAFEWSDLDNDNDVDLFDYAKFQRFFTGSLP